MKKIITLVLLLTACSEPDMTVSNALPVQLYPEGVQTYNEKANCGISKKCFYQPFLCTDPIKLQFYDSEADQYVLSVKDIDGVELESIDFVPTPDLFLPSLNAGENNGSGTSWNIDTNPDVAISGSGFSKLYRRAFIGAKSNTDYLFHYKIDKTATGSGDIYIRLYDASMALLLPQLNIPFSSGTVTLEGDFQYLGGSAVPAYMVVYLLNTTGNTTLSIVNLDLVTKGLGVTVFNYTYIPSDHAVCDQKIKFEIYRKFITNPLLNTGFDTAIDPWLQDLTNANWAMFGASAVQANGPSKRLYQFGRFENAVYTLHYDNARSISFGTAILTVALLDKDLNTLTTFTIPSGASTVTFNGYVGGVQVRALGIRGGGTYTGTITVYRLEPIADAAANIRVLRSDYLDIRSEHACTELVKYSNHRNYADLIYTATDTIPDFYIRVPCTFYHPEATSEETSMTLSASKVVPLTSVVGQKRIMTIRSVPYWFHDKMILVLRHQRTLEIDSLNWLAQDGYEYVQRSELYPWRPAKTKLTRKAYSINNIA